MSASRFLEFEPKGETRARKRRKQTTTAQISLQFFKTQEYPIKDIPRLITSEILKPRTTHALKIRQYLDLYHTYLCFDVLVLSK